MNHTIAAFTVDTFVAPEGFKIPVNNGLHGDMVLFELPPLFGNFAIQMSFAGAEGVQDPMRSKVCFCYQCHDSNEGDVFISYVPQTGELTQSFNDGWDVEIHTGSDCWGLKDTQNAITAALNLHKALGHNLPYRND